MFSRRDLLKVLLATPAAALVDYEQLLWVPKTIITVPALPPQIGDLVYFDLQLRDWRRLTGATVPCQPATRGGLEKIIGVWNGNTTERPVTTYGVTLVRMAAR